MYPLGKQFEVDNAKARSEEKSIIPGKKYRISVITDRVVRIEYSANGQFVDRPTQLIKKRNLGVPDFSVRQDQNILEIATKYFVLNYIKEQFCNNLNEEVQSIEKIPGGMSNNTYLVKTNKNCYTARIPGINAELFVGRKLELAALNKVKDNVSFVQYNYFDLQSGFKVSPYIIREEEKYNIEGIAKVLNELHNLEFFENDFKPFERFLYYERLVNIFDMPLCKEFEELKGKILTYRDFLEQRPKMPCHNDSQLSNHVFTNQQDILIDFEFTGNNDPLFDFACLGNDDLNIGIEAYAKVVNRNLTIDEIKVIELWYSLQALSWYLVAMFKFATGMNKTTGLDFSNIATYFLQKADNLLKKY